MLHKIFKTYMCVFFMLKNFKHIHMSALCVRNGARNVPNIANFAARTCKNVGLYTHNVLMHIYYQFT